MKVLTVGSDRKIFEEGSAVRARMVEYAGLFEELHVIVFALKSQITNHKSQIAPNCWIYSTHSWSRWLYIWNAIRISRSIVKLVRTGTGGGQLSKVSDWVIDAQDPFECGLAAYKIAQRENLPLHLQIHTDFLSPYFAALSFLNKIRVRIARKVLPRTTQIRVVSERIKNSLSQVNYQLSKVSVLPIWTDLAKFANGAATIDLKEKYPQWHFIILIASRLTKEKNVGFALKVLTEAVKKYPKIGMVIVGEGPLEKSLKRKAKSEKLESSVAFEGWQSDLVSYYKTANLFLQTSLYEGFGLSLLEAVASGCPTVSSDVGIAPELLNHKGHSFVCPVGELACFTQKVSELIENNQLRTFFSLEIAPTVVTAFLQSKEEYLAAYKASIESATRLSDIGSRTT